MHIHMYLHTLDRALLSTPRSVDHFVHAKVLTRGTREKEISFTTTHFTLASPLKHPTHYFRTAHDTEYTLHIVHWIFTTYLVLLSLLNRF